MVAMRAEGRPLRAIADAVRANRISHEGVGRPEGRRRGLAGTLNRAQDRGSKSLEKWRFKTALKSSGRGTYAPRPELQRVPRPPHAEAVRWVSTLNAIAHLTARALM